MLLQLRSVLFFLLPTLVLVGLPTLLLSRANAVLPSQYQFLPLEWRSFYPYIALQVTHASCSLSAPHRKRHNYICAPVFASMYMQMPVEIMISHILFLHLMEKSRDQLRSLCLWWTLGVAHTLEIHNYILHPMHRTNQPNHRRDPVGVANAEQRVADADSREAEAGAGENSDGDSHTMDSATVPQKHFVLRCVAMIVLAAATTMVCVTYIVNAILTKYTRMRANPPPPLFFLLLFPSLCFALEAPTPTVFCILTCRFFSC